MRAHQGKVFGVGLSKTGTTTLGACLERFGYRHFSWHQGFAERVLRGDIDLALRVARRHDSFDDIPWPALVPLLDDAFPDAKFVLTVRKDPDTWYRSMLRHAEYKGRTAVRREVYGSSLPHGSRAEHVSTYLSHNESVRERFAGRLGKLLVLCWEHDPGWAPLATFLGRSAPDGPIPHRNARRTPNLETIARRVAYPVLGRVRSIFT